MSGAAMECERGFVRDASLGLTPGGYGGASGVQDLASGWMWDWVTSPLSARWQCMCLS